MSSLRNGMVMVTLVACVGLAAAAHTSLGSRAGGEETDASLMDETTGSVGSPKSTELALSDEQRGRIYDGVMLVPDAQVAPRGGARGAPIRCRATCRCMICLPASPATFRWFGAINLRSSTTGFWSSIRQAAWWSR